MTIILGTCGYGRYDPGEGWKDEYESKLQAYSDEFESVELNKTFYDLPMVKTAEKWQENAFENFSFCMKAWQALTHTTRSPTWRNRKDDLTEEQKEHFGYLRPHDVVVEAWEETRKRAEALDAECVLLQMPPSFEPSDENINNMKELFDKIDTSGFHTCWEPRGKWLDRPEKIREICEELDLVHVTGLMREKPVTDRDVHYVRLHGLNEDRYDYDYDYSREELEELAGKLRELEKGGNTVYCMFNNRSKFENLKELREILGA